jgi:hypothetical protein
MPLIVVICNWVVSVCSWLIPRGRRREWTRERQTEIWHRWQFYLHAGAWNWREKLNLCRSTAHSVVETWISLAREERERGRILPKVRKPQFLLLALVGGLAILAIATGFLPACRHMARFVFTPGSNRLVILWVQPFGTQPKGVPFSMLAAWRDQANQLASFSAFNESNAMVHTAGTSPHLTPVVATDEHFFQLMNVRPMQGEAGKADVALLDYSLWVHRFNRDPKVIGTRVFVGKKSYPVAGILPADFRFLSRQPGIYVTDPGLEGDRVMVIARLKATTSIPPLEKRLAKIAADTNYYYYLFHPKIRSARMLSVVLEPFWVFCVCALLSGILIAWVTRVRIRPLREALVPAERIPAFRRAAFFTVKLLLGLTLVFAAGLEWARPQRAMLLTWTDGGSSLTLEWWYVLGAMGVFFLAVADQRVRCPMCLRSLAFPVRIGRAGSMFLDWSGTELLCSEGHGVLHVPLMATSWQKSRDEWISLDDSLKALFAEENRHR